MEVFLKLNLIINDLDNLMSVIIRDANIEDVQEILEIINYEIIHSTSIYDYSEQNLEQREKWFQDKKSTNMPVIVAEVGNLVVGFGSYGIFRPKEAYKYCVEHSVYIHKDFRNLGIGKLILEHLINLASEQGFHTMIAGIDAENKDSIGFHKKFGFVEVGRIKESGYKFDRWLDLVFMQLFLNNH